MTTLCCMDCVDGSGDISYEEYEVLARDGALMHGALRDYEAAFKAAAGGDGSGEPSITCFQLSCCVELAMVSP